MDFSLLKIKKNLLQVALTLCISSVFSLSYSQNTGTTTPAGAPPPQTSTTTTQNGNGTEKPNEVKSDVLINSIDQEKIEKLNEYNENMEKTNAEAATVKLVDGLPIFGSEIFGNSYYADNNSNNRPAPSSYNIGPNDKLRIDVSGKSLVTWEPTVAADGSIYLEGSGIGKIYVGGKSLETATTLISNTLKSYNFAIGNGTFVDVSLTNMRSFSINIVGEVEKPGTKLVNSYTSVLDALYLSGGITLNGTYRYIQVIRDYRIIAEVDLYDMLIDGDFSNNVFLQENDIVRVPVYRSRVGVTGEVKRKAIFEIKQGEVLRDVLKFAGGFTEYAFSTMIKVRQVTDTEIRLRDIYYTDYEVFIPMNGDRYNVEKVIDRVENRVTVQGEVFRPGEFELESTRTIKQLLEKAGGLKEEAFLNRAYLTRTNPIDNRMENIPLDLKGILNGDVEDIVLQREDVLNVLSMYDITDASTITVSGKVRNAITFDYYPGISIEDAILKANGFQDGADFMNVRIARRIHNSDRRSASGQIAEIIEVTLDPYLTVSEKNIKLEPYDVVYVYPFTGYSKPITVSVEGEILIPGSYPMTKKDNRISDLVKRAGGLNELANAKGATLYRLEVNTTLNEQELDKYQKLNRDVVNNASAIQSGDNQLNKEESKIVNNTTSLDPTIVSIDLPYILKNPGSNKDLILKEGDRLSIPTLKQTVTVKGNVGMPTIALYIPGKSVVSYINNDAGGFSEFGFRKKTQVIYPNGQVKVKRFLSGFPKIEPGCEIYVPYRKPREKTGFNYQSFIAISSSISSTAAIVLAVFRMNK